MAYYFLSNWMILFHFSITKPCRCKLKPRFLIKSGYYNVPNSSTALDYKPEQQWHLPISEHISYGVSNSNIFWNIPSSVFIGTDITKPISWLYYSVQWRLFKFKTRRHHFSSMAGALISAGVNSRLWSAPAYQLCSTCWAEYCRSRQCYDTEKCLIAISFTKCVKKNSTNTLLNHSQKKKIHSNLDLGTSQLDLL